MNLFFALLHKELSLQKSQSNFYLALTIFSLVLSVLGGFSFRYQGISTEVIREIFPAVLWLCSMFIFVIVLNHQTRLESEDGAISALMLSCGRSPLIYAAKCVVTATVLFFAQALTAMFLMLFFPLESAANVLWIFPLLFVSSFAVSALGTLLSLIAAASESKELLLPIVLFPLLLTVSGAAVQTFREILSSGSFSFIGFPFIFLCSFGVIVFATGAAVFDSLTEE